MFKEGQSMKLLRESGKNLAFDQVFFYIINLYTHSLMQLVCDNKPSFNVSFVFVV